MCIHNNIAYPWLPRPKVLNVRENHESEFGLKHRVRERKTVTFEDLHFISKTISFRPRPPPSTLSYFEISFAYGNHFQPTFTSQLTPRLVTTWTLILLKERTNSKQKLWVKNPLRSATWCGSETLRSWEKKTRLLRIYIFKDYQFQTTVQTKPFGGGPHGERTQLTVAPRHT
jgi:hypothetical protein